MGRRDDGEVTSLQSEPEGQSGPLLRMRTGTAASMLSPSRRRRNSDEKAG
jgi:hypothetical protein